MRKQVIWCPGCGAEMVASTPVSFYSMEHRTKWGCYYKCIKCGVWETLPANGENAKEAKKNAYEAAIKRFNGGDEN